MEQTSETSEHRPWTVQSVLEQLDCIDTITAKEICLALRSESETLAFTLRQIVAGLDGVAQVSAAAILLMLNDETGRAPFLGALSGPDGGARNLAIEFVEYYIRPHDIAFRGTSAVTTCPVSSDEVFAAIKRNLHEPWTGLSLRVLEIVSRQDYPQARALTRPLLTHPDALLRRMIAGTYLRAGRDEGAFAVIEELLRAAPAYIPHLDPRWHDFYQIKGLWYNVEAAAEHGDAELRNKAALLAMDLLVQALDAPDCAQRFDTNDGLIATPGPTH